MGIFTPGCGALVGGGVHLLSLALLPLKPRPLFVSSNTASGVFEACMHRTVFVRILQTPFPRILIVIFHDVSESMST